MNDTVATDGIAHYAAAVRAAFADLPAPECEELLEDLEDHLREVLAEAGGPLEERLGSPDAYADELRSSAGLPPRGSTRRRVPLHLRLAESAPGRLLRGAAAALAAHPAGRAVLDFLPELRPAWWVARGYLVVLLANILLSGLSSGFAVRLPVPAILGSRILGLICVAAAAAVSVRLGRSGTTTRRARRLERVANLALALFAVALLLSTGDGFVAPQPPAEVYSVTAPGPAFGLRMDGREISNIFAFDARGRPLRNVFLVDQDGNPVTVSHYERPDIEARVPVDANGMEIGNLYPQDQRLPDPNTGAPHPAPAPRFQPPPTTGPPPTTAPPTTGKPPTSRP